MVCGFWGVVTHDCITVGFVCPRKCLDPKINLDEFILLPVTNKDYAFRDFADIFPIILIIDFADISPIILVYPPPSCPTPSPLVGGVHGRDGNEF